jgi:dTDP-4-dehydrorhamnose 3,5-epimerase
MIFRELALAGAWIIDPEPVEDERGAFGRLYCRQAFADQGLLSSFDQLSFSFNARAGTVRGLHLQRPPHAETKLIRVTAGAAFDVFVDLRAGSTTYGRWAAVELTARNRRQVYVPPGLAHGFQTLEDGTELFYQIASAYEPAAQDGVVWDDPQLDIAWPLADRPIVSARDRGLPPLSAFEPIRTLAG